VAFVGSADIMFGRTGRNSFTSKYSRPKGDTSDTQLGVFRPDNGCKVGSIPRVGRLDMIIIRAGIPQDAVLV
jgi:hypothetical protein